jgi:thymidylate kinase
LKELYNLNLPESIDLNETSLDAFYDGLKAQIQASEPGVTLNKIDRPQIELIHERAKQRLDQYRRKLKVSARRTARSAHSFDYSYDAKNARPLGLQLFQEKVRPAPLPLREAAGALPENHAPNWMAPPAPNTLESVVETTSERFALRNPENQNPYVWDFDLCSMTLGNFNYRKMTLVRDYANLIETEVSSVAFDTIFSLAPKAAEETAPAPLDLADQHLIIACDATQASAIARAREGRSYIIQGPPGTGKSQTITNLIADYAARGKRVLFVCEKRAAIDIVFHRLRQQGLDDLCCLIHDSQTDKKAFIQDLKQTYENFLAPDTEDGSAEKARDASLKAMEQEIGSLRRFSEAMHGSHPETGVPLRSLLRRLVELGAQQEPVAAELEEHLPDYPVWLQHGDVVSRLGAALSEAGDAPCFAEHPTRWLGKDVVQADRPLEALTMRLDKVESLIDEIESALELAGLPADLWDTLEEIQAVVEFAARVRALADRDQLALLAPNSTASSAFNALSAALDEKAKALTKAREKTAAWRDPLSPDDTENALAQARAFGQSILRFVQPAYWRLKKTITQRYDFSRHAVRPTLTRTLEDLAAEHAARDAHEETQREARSVWRTDDPLAFRQLVDEIRSPAATTHASVRRFSSQIAEAANGKEIVISLAETQSRFDELIRLLAFVLTEYQRFDFPRLTQTLGELREELGALPDLLPILGEVAELPESLSHALRRVPIVIGEFEAAIARKSLHHVYRKDRSVSRFEGRSLAQRMDRLEKHYRAWLGQNARAIRATVRRRFLDHVRLSSLPAAQLDAEQKTFKRNYAAGRRDLEHEFGKTMRYKSIRDLAAGQTGQVIQDLKPIWLMSPLSVSDTLPLDPGLFDVVIFDEASQIPVEEAIPAVYRSNQVIVVGDEMQLPPTAFFASSRGDDDTVLIEEDGERFEVALDSDSFLTQSATNLPSTLLAWHYRSRYESLISFSNAAFYSGNLFTIPDRQRALAERPELRVTRADEAAANVDELLQRSLSFHFMEGAIYSDRRNAAEAAYIAHWRGRILGSPARRDRRCADSTGRRRPGVRQPPRSRVCA